MRWLGLSVIAAAIGFAGVYGFARPDAVATLAATGNCDIKGNISINTGEHIYHMPGQHFYAETIISPAYGERWFCSEAQAQAAGWRKARD